jgi:hypothetical protein
MSKKKKQEFTVFTPSGKLAEEGPIFKGSNLSLPDITCEECGYLIAVGIESEKIKKIFTHCPRCGALHPF